MASDPRRDDNGKFSKNEQAVSDASIVNIVLAEEPCTTGTVYDALGGDASCPLSKRQVRRRLNDLADDGRITRNKQSSNLNLWEA